MRAGGGREGEREGKRDGERGGEKEGERERETKNKQRRTDLMMTTGKHQGQPGRYTQIRYI